MFHDPGMFPFVRSFSENWSVIRDEYLRLNAPILDLHRIGDAEQFVSRLFRNNGWTPSWQVDSTEPNHNWLTYGLGYKGAFPDDSWEKLPFTTGLLSKLRGFKVCAFSLMRPRSFLAPHTHPELGNGMLTFHLGLQVVPKKSFLVVDGEPRQEQNGHALVFDGSFEHFAVNMSEADRVILYMEFDQREAAMMS